MAVEKFIKVEKQGDIYYYRCPDTKMSGVSCFISMRSDLKRELYNSLPNNSLVVSCNDTSTTTVPTTSTKPCDIQFQSVGFINNDSFPYDYTISKGYIKVEMTHLNRNPSYQFQILSGTTVVMDWTDPISTFTSFYFKLTCANYTVKVRDYYNQSCLININNISVPCLSTTTSSTTSTTSTTTVIPTTTSTTTTTTTTTVPQWNPCSVYSLESNYVDSVFDGHPKRETKVLINNYNQFTNVYSYYGEIVLSSTVDNTNVGFSVASYYQFISSTSLNNVGYTLLYDPNVNHDYIVVSYNLSTKNILSTQVLLYGNRTQSNPTPELSQIGAIAMGDDGNLYCATIFGIDAYQFDVLSDSWKLSKNTISSSVNTNIVYNNLDLPSIQYALADGASTSSEHGNAFTSLVYVPNLKMLIYNTGETGFFIYVDGSGKFLTHSSSFIGCRATFYIKDNVIYQNIEPNKDITQNEYSYTYNGQLYSTLVQKLTPFTSSSGLVKNSVLYSEISNLPVKKTDIARFIQTGDWNKFMYKTFDFVQTMACKNVIEHDSFTITEPTLTCYVEYVEANFNIYGGSDNYEISIDGGTSWTHYSETEVTLFLPKPNHTTPLGYVVYLIKIKDNTSNRVHTFLIPNTINCQ